MVEAVLTITQVAQRLGITTRTIRIYEEEGFIRLEQRGDTIIMDPEDVEILMVAERLKNDLGINLAGIGVILDMRRRIMALRSHLADQEAAMEKRIQEALANERRLAHRSVCNRRLKP